MKPFKLKRIENNTVPPNWRVETMKLVCGLPELSLETSTPQSETGAAHFHYIHE